jgi:excisionase family DNA binding protein
VESTPAPLARARQTLAPKFKKNYQKVVPMQQALAEDRATDRLMDINEASRFIGYSHWSVRAWTRSGRLPSHRIGKKILIYESDLRKLLVVVTNE